MRNNQNLLFLLHLPPPVHGSSIVGLSIKASVTIKHTFKCIYIDLLASNNVAESGKVNVKKIIGFIITFFKVFRSIIQYRPQLCYLALTTTGAAFYKDLLLVALLKLFSVKRLYHLHNKGVSRYQDKSIYRLCYQFVFGGTEVILLSKHLYSDIQSFVPISKIHICPNGIPDKGQSKKLSLAEIKKTVQILFLSNLIESKGVFVLLEACVFLKKKEILFECVFIGGEGDVTASQFNERVMQLGLGEQVSYQGKKYGKEKEQAFSEADIFTFPTYYSKECFPLVLLEAMSYSLPVVSTFEGGIPDIVEDGVTGFLVLQKEAQALADKLELLIQNPDIRRQMGAAGRKKYEKEFTLEIFENRLVEILQDVIEKD